ncbi:hypothetical protein QBC43DRAFT_351054 [Cladorrhinum sp. PSN259]|nr:hypothetical protein QBC43DRAFT_351054 [Cladorrhinum sp. PSN259]
MSSDEPPGPTRTFKVPGSTESSTESTRPGPTRIFTVPSSTESSTESRRPGPSTTSLMVANISDHISSPASNTYSFPLFHVPPPERRPPLTSSTASSRSPWYKPPNSPPPPPLSPEPIPPLSPLSPLTPVPPFPSTALLPNITYPALTLFHLLHPPGREPSTPSTVSSASSPVRPASPPLPPATYVPPPHPDPQYPDLPPSSPDSPTSTYVQDNRRLFLQSLARLASSYAYYAPWDPTTNLPSRDAICRSPSHFSDHRARIESRFVQEGMHMLDRHQAALPETVELIIKYGHDDENIEIIYDSVEVVQEVMWGELGLLLMRVINETCTTGKEDTRYEWDITIGINMGEYLLVLFPEARRYVGVQRRVRWMGEKGQEPWRITRMPWAGTAGLQKVKWNRRRDGLTLNLASGLGRWSIDEALKEMGRNMNVFSLAEEVERERLAKANAGQSGPEATGTGSGGGGSGTGGSTYVPGMYSGLIPAAGTAGNRLDLIGMRY